MSDTDTDHTFDELGAHGLLWLINTSVFHPRGFALGLTMDKAGQFTWTMLGDGTEPWSMPIEVSDDCFAAAEAFLNSLRPGAKP